MERPDKSVAIYTGLNAGFDFLIKLYWAFYILSVAGLLVMGITDPSFFFFALLYAVAGALLGLLWSWAAVVAVCLIDIRNALYISAEEDLAQMREWADAAEKHYT